MNVKDIIIIVVLIIILLILIKVFQFTKALQPVKVTFDKSSDGSSKTFNELEVKKIKVKQKPNRVLKILKAMEIPMTNENLLKAYNNQYKEISMSNINSFIRWLKKNNLLNSEQLEGGIEVFGISDWFDESGELLEEYFNKLKK